MPDWKSTDTIERLLAAIIASNGGEVDNMAVARYFNDTYDTVEDKCRVYKKQAQTLIKEAEEAGRMEMDMRKKKSAAATKATKKGATVKKGVKSGRVTKATRKTTSKIKKEVDDDESDVEADAEAEEEGEEV